MNLLFVCRYNRFRSRVAEALLRHYSKDRKINAKSAGTGVTEPGFPILNKAALALGKLGIKFDQNQGAQQITPELIDWADRIYVVADDASLEGLPAKKTKQIMIPDSWATEKDTLDTIRMIEYAVKDILSNLASK